MRELKYNTNTINELSGKVYFDNGSIKDLNRVFYQPSKYSTTSYLVWARTITLYINNGVTNFDISNFIQQNNPTNAVSVNIIISSGYTVGNLYLNNILPEDVEVNIINLGNIYGSAGTYNVNGGNALTLNRKAKIINQGNIFSGGGCGGRGGDGSDTTYKAEYIVPVSTTYGEVETGVYSPSQWLVTYSVQVDIAWNNVNVYSSGRYDNAQNTTIIDHNGYRYFRGNYVDDASLVYFYRVSRQRITTTPAYTVPAVPQVEGGSGGQGGYGAGYNNLIYSDGYSGAEGTWNSNTSEKSGKGGKGGHGGDWGDDGYPGSFGSYTSKNSQKNINAGLNSGFSRAGLSIVNWNKYSTPDSIYGNIRGSLT